MATDMKIAEAPDEPLDDFVIDDAYMSWQRREGVRVIQDFAFGDLDEIELSPWPRKGGAGAIIHVPNEYLPNDAHLVEIAPAGQSEPERHMYEENVYVLSGHGATRIWLDGQEPDMFEWEGGSFFSIPLNAWYQHFNVRSEPARYVAVTDAPPTMRRMRDDDFIFNNPFQFTSRYKGGTNQFEDGKLYNRRVWRTSFVPNAQDMPLYGWMERGAGGINVMLEMANNAQKAHISEFPVGTYKKAHRHGPGAHLVILSGVGFSLFWTKDDLSDLRKCDWKKGGMVIVPSDQCFHQHFNAGTTRARYLAMRPGSAGFLPPHGLRNKIDVSVKDGGCQIEYTDEDPKIHEIFEAELAKNGVTCRMKSFVSVCNGEHGPTSERDT